MIIMYSQWVPCYLFAQFTHVCIYFCGNFVSRRKPKPAKVLRYKCFVFCSSLSPTCFPFSYELSFTSIVTLSLRYSKCWFNLIWPQKLQAIRCRPTFPPGTSRIHFDLWKYNTKCVCVRSDRVASLLSRPWFSNWSFLPIECGLNLWIVVNWLKTNATCNFAHTIEMHPEDAHCTYFISGSTAARCRSMAIFFWFCRSATAATTSTGAVRSSSSFQIAHAPRVRTSTATCLQ